MYSDLGPFNLGTQSLLRAYYHALDLLQYDAAARIIKQATEISQPTHFPWHGDVWNEAAFIAARLHGDPQVARDCLRFLRKSKMATQAHTHHRVEAAVYLAESKLGPAKDEICQGLNAILTTDNPAIAKLDEDLLREMLSEITAPESCM